VTSLPTTSAPDPRDDSAPPDAVGGRGSSFDRGWLWLFVALVVISLPLLLFHYGEYHWFLRAEWQLLADPGRSGVPDLLEPHGGAHWVAVPRLIYLALWQVVGLDSYRPYQAVVVTMHLAVAVLLRVVMRRAGVRPSLATAAAAVFVLCGPGAVNTVWAFQVSFIGSLVWGLGQLLLSDHDGPFDRRDLLGLVLGVLAITSSGIGVTTTVAVGVAVLLRRGWRPALAHTLPLAALYGLWLLATDGTTSGPYGRPPLRDLGPWLRESVLGTFEGLGRFDVIAWLLAVLLVAGVVLLWPAQRGPEARTERTRLAMPIGLAVAAVFFAVTTGTGRAWLGGEGARSDRYIYLQAAFLLPLLAVAAEAVAHRWRRLTPALVVLFLLPIPANLQGFDEGIFGPKYMANRERILTTAVRLPFAHDVPRDVQPVPDSSTLGAATIGFLLDAEADGKLTPSDDELTDEVVNEFKVRLGVAQRRVPEAPTGCQAVPVPLDLDPEVGDVLSLDGPVAISTVAGGQPTSEPVLFQPRINGSQLTIELPDLHLRLTNPNSGDTVTLCDPWPG
jgi:hypothetical protein